ncbi:MAG: CBS domain-containing protein [Actinobacteria bacterium]|nr:CBS domain-containing protein [Actinomycetota bacterium]
MKEFLNFLAGQDPYAALDGDDLERLAHAVEAEYFTAGTTVVAEGAEPLDHLWVVRTGAVEVVDRGRVVDLLGPGDTFGHVSLLSGLPPALAVRAAEDTLCYRLPDHRTLLAHPERLRFAFYGTDVRRDRLTGADGGFADRAHAPVSRYVRPVPRCAPDLPVREVAALISGSGQSCALVDYPDGVAGIVTDNDFRRRVGSGEVGVDEPVDRLVTRPVLTVNASTPVATAFLQMVEHGVHHLVAVDRTGRPLGVVRVVDLASAEVRDPLVVRAAVDSASDLAALGDACRLLPATAVELWDTGVPPERIGGLLAAVVDSALRRLLHLDAAVADPGVPTSWLVLGSLARREVLPSSDVDTAVVWDGGEAAADAVRTAASRVLDDLESCGLQRCADGANANTPTFSRPLVRWRSDVAGIVKDPSAEGSLLLATMLADSRPVSEAALGREVLDAMVAPARSPQFLHALLEYILAARPPTGFVRDFVVEHSGEHRGQLNLKRGGLRPVTSLGRWVGVVTGDVRGTTPERLRRGAAEGLLTTDEAETLVGAYHQVYALLLAEEVEAIRAGRQASTYVAPGDLDSLTRRHLRESFRAIGHVQERLESEWQRRLG